MLSPIWYIQNELGTYDKNKYLVAEDYGNRGTSRVVDPTVHEQDNPHLTAI
jgi:hypothetical protein